jgi:VRR-NUC domain-containing protein
MTDDEAIEAVKRVWIPRETWRQEKAVVFAREAILWPHIFLAFDRSQAKDARSHLYESRRGLRKGTPDTLTITGQNIHVWAEWKSQTGKVTDEQAAVLARLVSFGDIVGVCRTIEDYRVLLVQAGVPLKPNAEYLALHYDGMVDSRIAKAEGRTLPAKPKRASPRKPGPRYTLGNAAVRRAKTNGVQV